MDGETLALQCTEDHKKGTYTYYIAHKSKKKIKAVKTTKKEKYLAEDAFLTKESDGRFTYSNTLYDKLRFRGLYDSSRATRIYLDRMRGKLYLNTKSKNPTYDPKKKYSRQYWNFNASYSCKRISNFKFDRIWEEAETYKAQKSRKAKK